MNTQSTMWNEEQDEVVSPHVRVLERGRDFVTYINHRTEEIWTEPIRMAAEIHHAPRSLHVGK